MKRFSSVFSSSLYIAIMVIFCATVSLPSFAQPQAIGGGGYRGGLKQKISPGSSDKEPAAIRGNCTVVASPSNPIQGACVSLLLVLTDADGNVIEKTRTTMQGQFDFITESSKTYRIIPGSKYYELATAPVLFHSGDRIGLRLKQKQ